METMTYAVADRVARITLDRPERGNGPTRRLIAELAAGAARADLDPGVHVIVLSGNGTGFCGGYDLVDSAEGLGGDRPARADDAPPPGSALDPAVMGGNHDPSRPWGPMVDHAMMSRNVKAFMSLFEATTPVICQVHG